MRQKILILGGSGLIGSSLTKTLLKEGYTICVVCIDKKKALNTIGKSKKLEIKAIDLFNDAILKQLIKNYDIIINLIGKLFEIRKGYFNQFHHEFPKTLSTIISDQQHFIHISALGIEASSKTSRYAKTKLDGEHAIINNAKNYNIIKPSLVFGVHDHFFNLFANLSKISPFLPLIGGGKSKFSPIYVEDIVKGIIHLMQKNTTHKNQIFEAYGPDTASFKALMQFILRTTHRKRLLIHIPFPVATIQANCMNLLNIYRLTADQVELLKYDNIGSNRYHNINQLIGDLASYKTIVPQYLHPS